MMARWSTIPFVLIVLLILLAACGNTGAPTAAVTAATPPAAMATPPIQPTLPPTPEPTAKSVSVIVGLNHINDWRPPTVEDTIASDREQGEAPTDPTLQTMLARAQETVSNTGFGAATVEFIDNGLTGDDYRAALPVLSPAGKYIWHKGSAYPIQMKADGTIEEGRHVIVEGSEDARLEWHPGIGGGAETELSLVKHLATLPDGRQAALLYWGPTSEEWRPVEGYQTVENMVAVGGRVYQFSSVDGSAVQIGNEFAGPVSLSMQNETLYVTDATGTTYWLDNGRFVNEQILTAERTAIPNPAEYSLGQLGVERLVSYKEVTYLSGDTYELFSDEKEPNIVYLARDSVTLFL
jgi:hypothetical protein